MGDRGQRRFVVAAVTAAVLALPAGASADLAPWLVGALPSTATPERAPAAAPAVEIGYRGSVPRRLGCRGTVTLTLQRGAQPLQRRAVSPDRRCGVRTAFRIERSALAGATRVRVVQRFRGRIASARLRVPSEASVLLGSRGLDPGVRAPAALLR